MFNNLLEKLRNVCGKIVQFCRNLGKIVIAGGRMIGDKVKIFGQTTAGKALGKLVVVLVVIAALIQLVFAVMIYGFKSENKATVWVAKVLPYPVAVVNYDFVTYSEYQNEKSYIHHFYASTQQGTVDYKEIDSQILDQLVQNKIILYEALRNHVKVNKTDVDSTLNNIEVQNGGQDKVVKVLNDLYGLTLDQFRDLVQTQMIRDKVDQTVIVHLTVRHILINVSKDAPADQVDAAKAKAQALLDQIKGGADFAATAKNASEDTASASNGGLLQPFERGDMVLPFSDAAFNLKVGQVSDLVRSDYGWHIIKLEERTGTIDQSFTDWIAGAKKKSLVLNFFKTS